jgi:hypothetical protein
LTARRIENWERWGLRGWGGWGGYDFLIPPYTSSHLPIPPQPLADYNLNAQQLIPVIAINLERLTKSDLPLISW